MHRFIDTEHNIPSNTINIHSHCNTRGDFHQHCQHHCASHQHHQQQHGTDNNCFWLINNHLNYFRHRFIHTEHSIPSNTINTHSHYTRGDFHQHCQHHCAPHQHHHHQHSMDNHNY
ncbi:hypothetical protein WISP_01396 [Willisornis vidua]|uniref:Histidine-rich glycoprotein-like n=1 Tax=Willisornis vidua TaxID=1566151 RepID=A0ABQ9DV78_9PASS|nr:hypothetical protein WISP_01396 [Willisornis vidua]